MANTTVYPYGTGGSLPTSIGIINDLTTGGADKALAAQQGVVLNNRLFNVSLPLNTSHSVNAYPTKVIDSRVTYNDSVASITFDKIIRVDAGAQYTVKVLNGASPASVSSRDSVIVDDEYFVKQVIPVTTTASTTNTVTFTASISGYLLLCVDANFVSIEIFGDKNRTDIYENVSKISQLERGYLYRYSVTVPKQTTFNDPFKYTFKANHTYVVIIESTQYWRDVKMGILGVGESILRFDEDHLSVVKFDVGNSDVSGNIYIKNEATGSNDNYTYTYIVEEWTEHDRWRISEPGTIRVAASTSSARDKYLSRYICDWENDEVELQAAIDGLPSVGGIVKLCDGKYRIGEVRDSGNSELGYLGLELTHPDTRHYIEISGDSEPIRTTDQEINLGATIFLGTDAVAGFDTTTHITVIGAMPTDSYLQRLARGINFTLKNVGINIPGNSKAIRGVDAEYCSGLQIENVCLGLIDTSTLSTTPNVECIGIRGLGGWNYGVYYFMKCVKVFGFGVGFDLGGEHLVMEQCGARYVDIPYRFYSYGDVTKMAHPQTLINCFEEHNKRGIVFCSNSRHPLVTLIDYNLEWMSTSGLPGPWNRTTKAVEQTPGDIVGSVSFVACRDDYVNMPNFQFWESGSGVNMVTRNNCDLLSGTTAQRPLYPTMLQRYYDTDLGRVVEWNGTSWV